jgi:alkanesulfonate monooxygenase SsuD/methylene tetrahydromethanopterin reductase-like flavin-dependent oxidoreductase (luciferase family)
VQQAQVVEQLAPGRLILGLGPSNQPSMERLIGANWRTPRQHLREYVTVTRSLLQGGSVDHEGSHYTARAQTAAPMNVPVMIGTLRKGTYELAGGVADGAISWLTPWEHLRDACLPVMSAAAQNAERQTPPLVVHIPFCVSDDVAAVREAVRTQFGFYPRSPAYAAMFEEAGFANLNGAWSEALIDAVVAHGNEESVLSRLTQVAREGAAHIIANQVVLDGASREQGFASSPRPSGGLRPQPDARAGMRLRWIRERRPCRIPLH